MNKDLSRLIIIADSEDNSYVEGKLVFEKVKEIIESYRPVFVLSEKMENQSMENEYAFKELMKKKKLSNMTSIGEVKELIKLCHRSNIKLIGMDFENFLMDMKQQAYVKKGRDNDPEMDEELEKLAKRRENKHVKMIRKYLKLTRKPIIAIVGAWHLREGSLIRNSFRDLEGVKFIVPINEKGKQVLGPEKGKLRWKEQIF